MASTQDILKKYGVDDPNGSADGGGSAGNEQTNAILQRYGVESPTANVVPTKQSGKSVYEQALEQAQQQPVQQAQTPTARQMALHTDLAQAGMRMDTTAMENIQRQIAAEEAAQTGTAGALPKTYDTVMAADPVTAQQPSGTAQQQPAAAQNARQPWSRPQALSEADGFISPKQISEPQALSLPGVEEARQPQQGVKDPFLAKNQQTAATEERQPQQGVKDPFLAANQKTDTNTNPAAEQLQAQVEAKTGKTGADKVVPPDLSYDDQQRIAELEQLKQDYMLGLQIDEADQVQAEIDHIKQMNLVNHTEWIDQLYSVGDGQGDISRQLETLTAKEEQLRHDIAAATSDEEQRKLQAEQTAALAMISDLEEQLKTYTPNTRLDNNQEAALNTLLDDEVKNLEAASAELEKITGMKTDEFLFKFDGDYSKYSEAEAARIKGLITEMAASYKLCSKYDTVLGNDSDTLGEAIGDSFIAGMNNIIGSNIGAWGWVQEAAGMVFQNEEEIQKANATYENALKYLNVASDMLTRAQMNAGTFQRILSDMVENGTEMLPDMMVNVLMATSGSAWIRAGAQSISLGCMGTRVFGSTNARLWDEGVEYHKRSFAAAVPAGIEVFTETLFETLGDPYGKRLVKNGTLSAAEVADRELFDIMQEKILAGVTDASKKPAIAFGLNAVFGFIGEGAEEGISGALEPVTDLIYMDKAEWNKKYGINEEDGWLGQYITALGSSDIGYQVLIGGLMGMTMGAPQNAFEFANESITAAQKRKLQPLMDFMNGEATFYEAVSKSPDLQREMDRMGITGEDAINAYGEDVLNALKEDAQARGINTEAAPEAEAQQTVEEEAQPGLPSLPKTFEAVKEADGAVSETNGENDETGLFVGESGVKYTKAQTEALAAIDNEALITAAEASYELPISRIGITEAQAEDLRNAGLLDEVEVESEDGVYTIEVLKDAAIYDERARRRSQNKQGQTSQNETEQQSGTIEKPIGENALQKAADIEEAKTEAQQTAAPVEEQQSGTIEKPAEEAQSEAPQKSGSIEKPIERVADFSQQSKADIESTLDEQLQPGVGGEIGQYSVNVAQALGDSLDITVTVNGQEIAGFYAAAGTNYNDIVANVIYNYERERANEQQISDRGRRWGTDGAAGGNNTLSAAGTGNTVQRQSAESRRNNAYADGKLRAGYEIRSAADITSDGAADSAVTVIPESDYDDELRAVADEVKAKTGKTVTFYLEPLALNIRNKNGTYKTASGVRTADGLFIQADNLRQSVTQLSRHEMFHDVKAENPGLLQRLRDILNEAVESGKLSVKDIRSVVEAYERRYGAVLDAYNESQLQEAGMIDVSDYILEEMIGDALGGMNQMGRLLNGTDIKAELENAIDEELGFKKPIQTATEKTGPPTRTLGVNDILSRATPEAEGEAVDVRGMTDRGRQLSVEDILNRTTPEAEGEAVDVRSMAQRPGTLSLDSFMQRVTPETEGEAVDIRSMAERPKALGLDSFMQRVTPETEGEAVDVRGMAQRVSLPAVEAAPTEEAAPKPVEKPKNKKAKKKTATLESRIEKALGREWEYGKPEVRAEAMKNLWQLYEETADEAERAQILDAMQKVFDIDGFGYGYPAKYAAIAQNFFKDSKLADYDGKMAANTKPNQGMIAMIKMDDRQRIVDLVDGEQHYAVTAYGIYPITEAGLTEFKNKLPKADIQQQFFDRQLGVGRIVQEMLDNLNRNSFRITEDPVTTKDSNGKDIAVLTFEDSNGNKKHVMVNQKALRAIDGGRLYALGDNGLSLVAGVNADGELIGAVLPIRPMPGNTELAEYYKQYAKEKAKQAEREAMKPQEAPAVEAAPTEEAAPAEEATPAAEAAPAKETKPKTRSSKAAPKAKNSIEDFGEKIGGARKDLWQKRGLQISDLEYMNEAEQSKYVKKDSVWPKVDYQGLVDAGASREAAFFIKSMRDAMPTTPMPPYGRESRTSEELRQDYINTIAEFRDALLQIKTMDDVKNFRDGFMVKNGWLEKGSYGGLTMTAKARKSAGFDMKMAEVASDYSRESNLQRAMNKKQFLVPKENKLPAGIEVHQYTGDGWSRNNDWTVGTYYLTKGYMILAKNFTSQEAAVKYAQENYAPKTGSGKKKFVPQQLEEIHRTGRDVRQGGQRAITGDDYLSDFGFRGGEFGNWVNQNERQVSLDYGYDALMDMADALGIDPQDISLGGELAIAFGARGKGGALAHFEPDRNVINLTKMKGAGSLGHEWAHALDHILGIKMNARGDLTRHSYSVDLKSMDRLVQDMKYKPMDTEKARSAAKAEAERYANRLRAYFSSEFDRYNAKMTQTQVDRLNEIIGKILSGANTFEELYSTGDYTGGVIGELNDLNKEISGRIIPKETRQNMTAFANSMRSKLENVEAATGREETDFYKNSKDFDQDFNKQDGYWQSTEEMFARAFACYLHDKISGVDNRSDYLVGHSENAINLKFDKDGNPYFQAAIPQGEERAKLNEDFDALIAELKEKGMLHEMTPNTEEYSVARYSLDEEDSETGNDLEGEDEDQQFISKTDNRYSIDEAEKETTGNEKAIKKVLAGTLFSGGGTVDVALASIIDSQFAVEVDPKIAAVYKENNKTKYMGGDVREFDTAPFKGEVAYVHASPVCKTYSGMISKAAKQAREESRIDMLTAEATANMIRELELDMFTLENVPQYQGTEALKTITDTLDEMGYTWDGAVYNAADFGAATSRSRYFIRAVKDGVLPDIESLKTEQRIGWWDAVMDLEGTEDMPIAARTNPRMIDSLKNKSGIDVNQIDRPLIVFGESYANGEFGHAFAENPIPTIIANSGASKIFMPNGTIYDATPRVLARLTGLPDDYKLPKSKDLARTIIGNGIPVKLTQAIAGSLINANSVRYSLDEETNDRQGINVNGTPVEEYVSDLKKRNEEEMAERLRLNDRNNFKGSEALDKLGVKIAGSVAVYHASGQMALQHKAAESVKREAVKAEKLLKPTPAEKRFAEGLAEGIYTEDDIPDSMDFDKVTALADYYWAAQSVRTDLLPQQRRDINAALDSIMDTLFRNSPIKKVFGSLIGNFRTPERIMRSVFGDKAGRKIYEAIFEPVSANEAERFRFKNRVFDKVRKFENSRGKMVKLSKGERALTQKYIEHRVAGEMVAQMELDPKNAGYAAIVKAYAEILADPKADQNLLNNIPIDKAGRAIADKYARWLEIQDELNKADMTLIENAARAYQEQFDMFYEAINDFLTAHGYEPIGFIKGYAPHMQAEETQTMLSRMFASMGLSNDVTQLPAEIAGRTAGFRPNKRWNPYFLERMTNSENVKYDIAEAFESYVDYMSDVLYHTDDIMRVRAMERYLRMETSQERVKETLQQMRDLQTATASEKQIFLETSGQLTPGLNLPDNEIKARFDQYVTEYYAKLADNTKASDLVTWLMNYANKLAGKQLEMDRGVEQHTGRPMLNIANKLSRAFGASQVGGKFSSMLNQGAQLPAILAELGDRYFFAAVKDFAFSGGRLRKGEWAADSDFLTGKNGVDFIVHDLSDMIADWLFVGADFVDGFLSTIATRGAYRKAIDQGMEHKEAMRYADRFAENIMGSRMKGTKPMAFESKDPIWRMLTIFQVEAMNSFDHLVSDLPADFREIAEEKGKAAASFALANVLLKAIIASFLLNRLDDELYGGTPAPYDILGITGNFIASGNNLRENDLLLALISDSLDEIPELNDGKFDWETALKETGGDVLDDIPVVKNAASMLGLGDNTLPLAGLKNGLNAGKAAWGLVTGNSSWQEFAEAAAKFGMEFMPGGSQLARTIEGVKAYHAGGSYTASGKLRYFVDQDPVTLARMALFGQYSTPDAQRYFAGGAKTTTAKAAANAVYIGEQTGWSSNEALKTINSVKSAALELGKDVTQVNVEKVLNGRKDLSNTEKAYIWQAMDSGWSSKNNPYSIYIGSMYKSDMGYKD